MYNKSQNKLYTAAKLGLVNTGSINKHAKIKTQPQVRHCHRTPGLAQHCCKLQVWLCRSPTACPVATLHCGKPRRGQAGSKLIETSSGFGKLCPVPPCRKLLLSSPQLKTAAGAHLGMFHTAVFVKLVVLFLLLQDQFCPWDFTCAVKNCTDLKKKCTFPYTPSVRATYLMSIKTDFSILYALDTVLKKTTSISSKHRRCNACCRKDLK